MRNLDKEYLRKQIIYSQQKEYRKTENGKIALKRAREKQLLKKMRSISKISGGGETPHCFKCGQLKFEVLTITNSVIICYNCKYERSSILRVDPCQ